VSAQVARPAQSPLSPFGVSEATVRTQLLESVSGNSGQPSNRLLSLIQDGYQRIPVSMRAAATTAAFTWAKSYVSSPTFTTAYAQYREERKPEGGVVSTDSIDVEAQKQIADLIAQLEEIKKGIPANLDPATRAGAIKNIDDQVARYRSPETLRQMRMSVEAQRGDTSAENTKAAAEFAEKWPPDPKVYVKKQLERFMSATASIDYSLAAIWVKNPAGKIVGFLSPGLEDISWETMHSIGAGKEAVNAARSFVSAWLKELP
jgi:hypothetical protein